MNSIRRAGPSALDGTILTDPEAQCLEARRRFYAAISTLVPHVLADLASSCLPMVEAIPVASLALIPPEALRADPTIRICVKEWATRYRLAADWLIDDAIDALVLAGGGAGPINLVPHRPTMAHVAMTFTVSHAFTWRPGREPRETVEELFGKALRHDLSAQLDRIEAEVDSFCMTQGKDYRAFDDHAAWLVQRFVLRWTEEEIAARADPPRDDESTVRKGIRQAREMIGLQTLRGGTAQPQDTHSSPLKVDARIME